MNCGRPHEVFTTRNESTHSVAANYRFSLLYSLLIVLVAGSVLCKSPRVEMQSKSISLPDGSRIDLFSHANDSSLYFVFDLEVLIVHVSESCTAKALWGEGVCDGRLRLLDTVEITGDSIPEILTLWEDEGQYWGNVHHVLQLDSHRVKLQTISVPYAGWFFETIPDSLESKLDSIWESAASRNYFRIVGDTSIVFKGWFSDCDSIVVLFDRDADSLRTVCVGEPQD